jgi:hypothetical protein
MDDMSSDEESVGAQESLVSEDESQNEGNDSDESIQSDAHFETFHSWIHHVLYHEAPLDVSREQWNIWFDTASQHVRQPNQFYDIGICEFICLVTDSVTRQLFSLAVAEIADNLYIAVDLQGLEETLNALALSGIAISPEELEVGASALALTFGQFPRVQALKCFGYGPSTLSFMFPILTASLSPYEVVMSFDDTRSEAFLIHMPTLVAYFTEHPSLVSVGFANVNSGLLQMLSTVLLTIPMLRTCRVDGPLGSLTISSRSDAVALTRLLAMAQLDTFDVNLFTFSDDPQITQIICDGLRTSRLTSLGFYDVIIPPRMGTAIASAVSEIHSLNEFLFKGQVDRSFWPSLGQGWDESCGIRRLVLGGFQLCFESDDVAAFLQNARVRELCFLELFLVDWTPGFDVLISNLVRVNATSLKEMDIFTSPDFPGALIASEALLAAVDSPECCLAKCTFLNLDHVASPNIDPTWLLRFKFILGLNKQRRRRNSAFERVRDGSMNLLDAVADIDGNFLYEFLRRNEWNLQNLLRDYYSP